MNQNTKFYIGQMRKAKLVGGTITGFCVTEQDELGDEFFGLNVKCSDGKTRSFILLADEEGNGPGSFEIADA